MRGGLVRELSRRRVFRVAATYVVTAWITVQVANAFVPALRLPEWALGLVVYLLVLGFPITLLLAWAFDVEPVGLVTTDVVRGNVLGPRQIAMLVILALASTLALFALLRTAAPGVTEARADISALQESSSTTRIAVLPFKELGPGATEEWFGEGLADEVATLLATDRHLRVARGSAARRDQMSEVSARQIGEELGVGALLDGSIRRFGSSLRISVRLVEAGSGHMLWSTSLDASYSDADGAMGTQQAMARIIVNDLRVALGLAPLPPPSGPGRLDTSE